MPIKQSHNPRRKVESHADQFWEQIMRWLETASPAPSGWAALFRELQTLLASLFADSEITQRQHYFEKAMAPLRQRAVVSASPLQEIDFHLQAGRAHENFGAWDQALAAYQRAVELGTTHRLNPQKAEALRWSGNVHTEQGHWQPAEQAYHESLQLCAQHGDTLGQAHAENDLGGLFFEQGELGQALTHWEKALELAERSNANYLIAVIYNNLGALANVQGRGDKALSCYGESLPRFEATGNIGGMASTYHNMAMNYADNGNWAEASIHYEKSYRLAQQLGDAHLQKLVKLNRVELCLAIGDTAMAEGLCRQALQMCQNMQDHLGEVDADKFLGMINARKRAWKKAKAHFEKSIRAAQEFNYPLGEAEARWEYGRMLKQKGAAQNAAEQFEQALALFRKVNAMVEIEKVKKEISEV